MTALVPIGYLFITVLIFFAAVAFVWYVLNSEAKTLRALNSTLSESLSIDRKELKAEKDKVESLQKEIELFDEALRVQNEIASFQIRKISVGDLVKGESKDGRQLKGVVCTVNKYGVRIKTEDGKFPYLIPKTVELI